MRSPRLSGLADGRRPGQPRSHPPQSSRANQPALVGDVGECDGASCVHWRATIRTPRPYQWAWALAHLGEQRPTDTTRWPQIVVAQQQQRRPIQLPPAPRRYSGRVDGPLVGVQQLRGLARMCAFVDPLSTTSAGDCGRSQSCWPRTSGNPPPTPARGLRGWSRHHRRGPIAPSSGCVATKSSITAAAAPGPQPGWPSNPDTAESRAAEAPGRADPGQPVSRMTTAKRGFTGTSRRGLEGGGSTGATCPRAGQGVAWAQSASPTIGTPVRAAAAPPVTPGCSSPSGLPVASAATIAPGVASSRSAAMP